MKRGFKMESKRSAALIELKHDASELLDAINSVDHIERKLKDELAAFDRSGDAIDRLETKRRALLLRPMIKTKQLATIEEEIDDYRQLLAIAQRQAGKLALGKSEIMQTLADIRAKIANNKKLKRERYWT